MAEPKTVSAPTFASRTPLHIGRVGLAVRDLGRAAGFYRDVVGLDILDQDAERARLGAGGVALLELESRPDALPDDPRSAGLFHTAFLMPTRPDLAHWLTQVAQNRVPITGTADHGVSEAIYLDDPEGNGIEVYADRPPERWRWRDGEVNMPTEPLDVQDILTELDRTNATIQGAPAGLRIGHVHLRVGDLADAESFYRDGVGLDVTRHRQGASFMSSGRYHHHIGSNIWRSHGAGRRDDNRAGLAWFSFKANDDAVLGDAENRLRQAGASITAITDGFEARDPWGTRVRLEAA